MQYLYDEIHILKPLTNLSRENHDEHRKINSVLRKVARYQRKLDSNECISIVNDINYGIIFQINVSYTQILE